MSNWWQRFKRIWGRSIQPEEIKHRLEGLDQITVTQDDVMDSARDQLDRAHSTNVRVLDMCDEVLATLHRVRRQDARRV